MGAMAGVSASLLLALCLCFSAASMVVAFSTPTCGVLGLRFGSSVEQFCKRNDIDQDSSRVSLRPLHTSPGRAVTRSRPRPPGIQMSAGTDSDKRVQKILPLYDGRNLIIGDTGWFLESSTGEDELYGDFAVPLEMDDEERGEFTEWILYRDGEVITTVTEDQIDTEFDAVSTMTLTNPIGSDLKTGAGGFVLGALASMVGMFGDGGASSTSAKDGKEEQSAKGLRGDQGTAFRMFGSIFGMRTTEEEDQTWALWDVNRNRPADTSAKASTSTTAPPLENPAASPGPTPSAADSACPPTPSSPGGTPAPVEAVVVGEDSEWVSARREGMMLLREAAVTMKQGEFDTAAATFQKAIDLLQVQVARGVGPAAEEMLARAFADATTAAEANMKQAESRAEALRLANEAEQWLTSGDLDTAFIMAERSQAALNEVEEYYGRVRAEELTRVLEVKVRVQEKRQLREISSTAAAPLESGGAVPGAASKSAQKREELEARQRQKLVERKKEEARKKRSGEEAAPSEGGGGGEGKAPAAQEAWRQDKNLAASLDRAARQALKEDKFDEVVSLATRASVSFQEAGRKGYKRGETEARGSLNLVARAKASLKLLKARASMEVATEGGEGGAAARGARMLEELEQQNAELEALFAVEAFSTASVSQASVESREGEEEAEEEKKRREAEVIQEKVRARMLEREEKARKEEQEAAAKEREREQARERAAAEAAERAREEEERAAEARRQEEQEAKAEAEAEARAQEAAKARAADAEQARKEAEQKARAAAEVQRQAAAEEEREKAKVREMEARKQEMKEAETSRRQEEELEAERQKLREAEEAARKAREEAARAKEEEERMRKEEEEEEARLAAEALARLRARTAAKKARGDAERKAKEEAAAAQKQREVS
jgi:hypothetical protein